MAPLETYLRAVSEIHASGAGVDETSYYPALSNLLNEVGGNLKPRVHCIISLADSGPGRPDGGLFTADQIPKRAAAVEPPERTLPPWHATGLDVPIADLGLTEDDEQTSQY